MKKLLRRAALAVGYLVFVLVTLELVMRLGGVALTLSRALENRESLVSDADLRILAVGESTTFGVGVEPDQAYPKRLQRILDRDATTHAVVFNTGVVGQTSTSILRNIDYQMEKFRPQIVLLLFGANDLNETLNDVSSRLLFGFLVPDFIARLRIYRLAAVTRDYLVYAPRSETEGAWIFFDPEQKHRGRGFFETHDLIAQLRRNYVEVIEKVRHHGAEPVMLSYLHGDLRQVFRSIADEAGAVYIELPQMVAPEYYLPDRFHPNPLGHLRMAQHIYVGLMRNEVLPRSGSPESRD